MTKRTYTSRRQYTNFVQVQGKLAHCQRCKREIEARYRYCYHCVMAFRRKQMAGDPSPQEAKTDTNRTDSNTQGVINRL